MNGIASDWDSDGDLDIGTGGTDPTNMFVARSASTTFAALQNGAAKTYFAGGSLSVNSDETIINPSTSELRIGTIRFAMTGAFNPNIGTAINFVRRPSTDSGSALWFEDGIATGKVPGNGAYTIGAPVFVNPEPATLGLLASPLAIAIPNLLARRRKGADRRDREGRFSR